MKQSNTATTLDMLINATAYQIRLTQMLARAEAEGRDITDEEVDALRQQNLDKLDELINRRS